MRTDRERKTGCYLFNGWRVIVSVMCVTLCVMLVFSGITPVYGTESDESTITGLADSPWPKYRGNVRNTGLSPYDTSQADGTELWRFETGDRMFSSPAVGTDGTIYVGSNDRNMYAINPDGTEKWSFWTGVTTSASPAVGTYGTIYFGSSFGLYALHPDGTEFWIFTPDDYRVFMSPSIGPDDTIYVNSWESGIGGARNHLYAVNPDGSEKWSFATGGGRIIGGSHSPAIGTDGTIYFGSLDANIFAVNPDGTERWRFPTGGLVHSSPAIGADGTIYIGSNDNYVYALNPDGTEKWRFGTGDSVTSSPAIGADGTIYIGSQDNIVYAINPDGTEEWSFTTEGPVSYSSPAIGADGTIYIGSYDNKVYAINPDGTEKWSFTTGSDVSSSPAIGKWGVIYVSSHDNNLYALGPATLPVPEISDETPSDGSIDIPVNTILSVHVEAGAYPAEVEFYLDDDLVHSQTVNADGIVETEQLALDFDTTYDWMVTVENNEGVSADRTFSFTTVEPLVLTIDADEGGTTVPPPGVYHQSHGDTVTVEAVPDEGWHFSHWSGDVPDGQETNEEITIVIDGDKTITAHFERVYHILTVNIIGEGITVPSEGDHPYTYGTEVNITATPDEGWIFCHWSGDIPDGQETNENITVVMYGDKNITAHFDRIHHNLTIAVEGEGTTLPEDGEHSFAYGTSVNISATPDEGWHFSHWSGDVPEGQETNENITIIIDRDRSITAHFREGIPPTVVITTPGYDSILDPGEVTVEWTSEEGTYAISHYQIRLGGGDWINVSTATAHTFTVTDPGDHVVTVRVFDSADNTAVASTRFAIRHTDDTAEESFLGSYWWLLLLVTIVAAMVILYTIKRGRGEEPVVEEDTPEMEEDTVGDEEV